MEPREAEIRALIREVPKEGWSRRMVLAVEDLLGWLDETRRERDACLEDLDGCRRALANVIRERDETRRERDEARAVVEALLAGRAGNQEAK